MNKTDVIDKVTSATGMTRNEVTAVLESVLRTIEKELASGGKIELRRFGVFDCKRRLARKAVNPRTGETIFVEEKVVPSFRASAMLRKAVKNAKL